MVDDGDLFRGAEEEEVQVEGEGNRLQDYIMDEEVGSFCTICGYKEMSSILADQKRSSYASPNSVGWGEVAGSQPMSTAVHIT